MKQYAKPIMMSLSQNPLLRKVFPIFGDYYAGRFQNDESRLAIFFTKVEMLRRTLTFWRYAPRKNRGGLILNLLGFQILRYAWFNVKYRLRPQRSTQAQIYKQVSDEGCAVLPNYLSNERVEAVLSFYETHIGEASKHFKDFSELIIADNRGPFKQTPEYLDIFEKIKEWTNYKEVAETLIKKDLRVTPFISILKYRSELGSEFATQSDGQDTPHVDVFYPSFKMFIYLNDVPVENGPLTYYKKSQAFTFWNALTEYVTSVRYFWSGKDKLYPIDHTKFRFDKNYVRTPLSAQRGSAVLFNVQGIHCRGAFKKDVPRERLVLLVDFRQAECLIQKYAA
jgi:hypothetical protein